MYLYSIQNINIQRKIFLTHENIILNNGLSKVLFRIFFIFYQCAVNCVMVSGKKPVI